MIIEELIFFDKRALSENRLIFGRYNIMWFVILMCLFTITGVCLLLFLYLDNSLIRIASFLLVFIFFWLLLYYSKKKKILNIVAILRAEEQYPRYKYQFLQVFLVIISTVLAAFFAVIATVPNLFSSWRSVIIFFKPIFGFFLLFILFFWFCEEMLIRGLFEANNRKYKRLIRLLENHLLLKNSETES